MNNSKILTNLAIFFFGLAVGGFTAITVVREAVPLRDHVWMIGISLACAVPIVGGLIFWYLRVIDTCRRVLGAKGGEMINAILTFQVVSVCLLFMILLSIFYAAIA
ncbi:MAG: hypothetical protein ONB44_02075 [candidate division KSB1 bacterium]|nr:hypothetical protein [candidate division KSB1 bacterium]MDZ7300910.1 hypothetical protein [candidate division KSB1 bacterium]MDZ7314062.1 hypothetical protein [candidate division KSB1 bacterium]